MEEINTQNKTESIQNDTEKKERKIKNLISLVILLFGLLLGSLFVDIGQIIKSSGYSPSFSIRFKKILINPIFLKRMEKLG